MPTVLAAVAQPQCRRSFANTHLDILTIAIVALVAVEVIANITIVLTLAGGKALEDFAPDRSAPLTGESLPRTRREGEPILSGSVNGNSSAIIMATASP